MEPHIRDAIQAIRDKLSDADDSTTVTAKQIGDIIIAAGQLTDLVERLYTRIIDLERVQNEEGEQ
jgi:hypothetical protein